MVYYIIKIITLLILYWFCDSAVLSLCWVSSNNKKQNLSLHKLFVTQLLLDGLRYPRSVFTDLYSLAQRWFMWLCKPFRQNPLDGFSLYYHFLVSGSKYCWYQQFMSSFLCESSLLIQIWWISHFLTSKLLTYAAYEYDTRKW